MAANLSIRTPITIQFAVHTLKTTQFKERRFASPEALNRWLEQQESRDRSIEILRYEAEGR